jgi:hypothetical protein
MADSTVTISNREELDIAFGSIGMVRSRTGPNKRTQDDMEWYVIREFLRATINEGYFILPVTVRKESPPLPDFVLGADGKELLVEITTATNQVDQREMTEIERSGKPQLLGTYGGRVAANPQELWVNDVIEAIKIKKSKSKSNKEANILLSSHPYRHLLIYQNSNMSILLFDRSSELQAIRVLRSEINRQSLVPIVNGCCVNVLAKNYVILDILGQMHIVDRARIDQPLEQGDDDQLFASLF